MMGSRRIISLWQPLSDTPLQAFSGQGLCSLKLLRWILCQTGRASVFVSTNIVNKRFLTDMSALQSDGLLGKSMILLDEREADRCSCLYPQMLSVFNYAFLGRFHTRMMLIHNDSWHVSVITSRSKHHEVWIDTTIVTTYDVVYQQQIDQFISQCLVQIENKDDCQPMGWRPFGYEF